MVEPMAATPLHRAIAALRSRFPPVIAAPRRCEVCGQWSPLSICPECSARFAVARQRCPQCALPSASGLHCGACLREPPAFIRCVTVADYGFPWDRLIAAFKFRDRPELASALAVLMDRALQSQQQLAPVDLVLPVPLAPQRLRERGYNQAWELARRVARRRGIDHDAGVLLRLQDAAHQVGSGRRQRWRNLQHAMWIEPHRSARLAGRSVALVDDVMTSGGTAQAAALALRAAGASAVQVWVVARTLPPDG